MKRTTLYILGGLAALAAVGAWFYFGRKPEAGAATPTTPPNPGATTAATPATKASTGAQPPAVSNAPNRQSFTPSELLWKLGITMTADVPKTPLLIGQRTQLLLQKYQNTFGRGPTEAEAASLADLASKGGLARP